MDNLFVRLAVLTSIVVCFVVANTATDSSTPASEDDRSSTPQADALFFNPGTLTSGSGFLEMAARAVAQLVSSNFSVPKKRPPVINDLVDALLRLLGLDSTKMSAVAVNALIFIAQLLGSSLSTKMWDDKLRDDIPPPGTPLTWIFDNSPIEARDLVHAAEDSSLPDQLIHIVRNGSSDVTDCVELLICYAAPVVWSMQRYLYKPPDRSWPSMSPLQRMFASLPTFKQIVDNSEGCDVKFPACKARYDNRPEN